MKSALVNEGKDSWYTLSLALRWQICNRHGSASEKYRKMIIQWIPEDFLNILKILYITK